MMILVFVIAFVALAVVFRVTVPLIRRRLGARELRGDWWPRFEREFREYSNRFSQAARDAEWRA
jgi:hypothetical protein